MTKPKITVSDVEEWLNSPVTKSYFEALKYQAGIRRELVANGICKKDTAYETGEAYIRALTQAEVYEACATPSVEDVLPEEE